MTFSCSLCSQPPYLHHVYPLDEASQPSPIYRKMLDVLVSSPLHTSDPDSACIFVLSLDTLDRDHLSDNYVKNLQSR